tara:strand:- start:457 stop:2223 length:1767 start_codon:yes stop_codon:yes gene_type:complete
MNPIKLAKHFFNKKLIIFIVFLLPLLILSAALEIIGISLVPLLIGAIFDPTKILVLLNSLNFNFLLGLKNYLLTHETKDLVGLFTFLFLFIYFLKNLILILIIYFENFLTLQMRISLTYKLSKKYFNASYIFHINSNSSFIINNLNQEIKVAAEYFKNIISAIREVLLIVGVLTTLLLIYPYITIISLCFLTFALLIFYLLFKNYLYKLNKSAFNYRRKFQNIIKQALGSIKSTLILQREKILLEEIIKTADIKERIDFKVNFFSKLPRVYFELLFVVAICLFVFYIDSSGIVLKDTFVILSTLAVAMARLLPSFNSLLANLISLKGQKISALHIYNEMTKLNKFNKRHTYLNNINQSLNDIKNQDIYGDIKFINVDYKYPYSNKYIFKNLNINLKKNHNIAIVGESGAGKTTFIDLILGLLDPTVGKITSNNIDVHYNQNIWRKNLGYVPQEIYLMDDTIKNNILIGLKKNKINHENLNLSLKNSGVSAFVQKQKLNTIVGENGIKISGGQKQRIGIARALYKNPKVIIFDEATNSLDKKNETNIMNDIRKFSKNRTIIFITHKKDNLKFFDTVVEIKNKKAKIIKI